MALNKDDQIKLFSNLSNKIIEYHQENNHLFKFTDDKHKGIVILTYENTKDIFMSFKDKIFNYKWINKDEAFAYNHHNLNKLLVSYKYQNEVIFVIILNSQINIANYALISKMKNE